MSDPLRLVLLRHAHSGHRESLADIDRTLSDRGRDEAVEMGGYMAQEGLVPVYAIVSVAQRTRETWATVQKQLPEQVPAVFEPRIYEAAVGALLEVVRAAPDKYRTVVLVGHNPGISALATRLIGRGGANALVRLRHDFPPAGLAVIDFSDAAGWADISDHSGELERFATPASNPL